jgi:hypothetical protein
VVRTGSLKESLKKTSIANAGGESESVAREGNLIPKIRTGEVKSISKVFVCLEH